MLNAEANTPSTERSVDMPGCTARSMLGVAKSVTSATSRSVVLAPVAGGARSVAHWMTVSPSGEALMMPLVPAAP